MSEDTAEDTGAASDRDAAGDKHAASDVAATIPADLGGQLALLDALVEQITSADPYNEHAPMAAEGARRVQAAQERLSAQRLGWISRVKADGLWALDTMHGFVSWLARDNRISAARAKRDIASALMLRDHLPRTAIEVRQGVLTTDHIGILVRVAATSDARRAALTDIAEGVDVSLLPKPRGAAQGEAAQDEAAQDEADAPTGELTGEEVLLTYARAFSLQEFTRIAKRFAVITDPESDERGQRRAQDREHFDISKTLDGFHIRGFITEEHGQLVTAALNAVMGRRPEGDHTPTTQRRAIALAGLSRIVLDKGLVGAGASVRPHMSVLVPWVDFLELSSTCGTTESSHGVVRALFGNDNTDGDGADGSEPNPTQIPHPPLTALLASPGPTWEDGTGPVPRRVLERIAADCSLTRIIFGPDSQILDVGRTKRTLKGSLRQAVIARDRHCVWPGCETGPQFSQIHHAKLHWADGGTTSTDNSCLLCWAHHAHVDNRNIALTWANGWHFGEPGSYAA